jgi:UDP-N-acetylglucosamine acyltransferase
MALVHPTAIVGPDARLANDVEVGPFCIVGDGVDLGAGVRLHSHAVVVGNTRIGPGTEIYPFASIGHAPQDLKFRGEGSRLDIGSNNRIREYVTMNPGTEGGGMVTKVGDNCLFMASAHVAHDCTLGNNVIMANNATLAGHVQVGDFAVFGGLSAVHQFVRIGAHAMIGGMAGVTHDVIPYGTVVGSHAYLSGLNLIGLRRRGFPRGDIDQLRHAFEQLFEDRGTLAERLKEAEAAFGSTAVVKDMLEFVGAQSSRGVLTPKGEHGR